MSSIMLRLNLILEALTQLILELAVVVVHAAHGRIASADAALQAVRVAAVARVVIVVLAHAVQEQLLLDVDHVLVHTTASFAQCEVAALMLLQWLLLLLLLLLLDADVECAERRVNEAFVGAYVLQVNKYRMKID